MMLFRDLPDVTICEFKAGDHIIRHGDPMPYVYYLIKGEIKNEVLTIYGSEIINAVKKGGSMTESIVGLLEIYAPGFDGTCIDEFIALTDCVCYRIPMETCFKYMGEHPELLAEALTMTIGYFNEIQSLLLNKKDLNATQLVCRFLMLHAVQRPMGSYLPKRYDNTEISKHLSLHSVTISRILSTLKREGVIKRTKEGWLLCDFQTLFLYSEGAKNMKYY